MAYIPTTKSDFDTRLAHLLPDYSHAPPDARIIELLHTNTPPTPVEKKSLEATLSETPDRVAELDSLIDSTTSLLRYLTKDRNQALENQANAKNILSPSRRLPTEVLTKIFIRCSSLYDRRGNGGQSPSVPPEIWSNIRLDFVRDQFLNGSRKYEAAFMLGVVLDRARPHDLDVIIELEDDIYTHPACAVLLPSARYWKSLDITGQSCDLGFLSPCREFFDRLETAVVRGHLRGELAADSFYVAPRLRSFTTSAESPFLLPANLVEFMGTNPFNEKTSITVRHCPNIQILSLSCSSYSDQSPKIRLPRLSQLLLGMDRRMLPVDTAFVTYNHFDLPSLTHLDILFCPEQLGRPLEQLHPIHSSTVTSLTLTWPTPLSRKMSALDNQPHLSSLFALPNLLCLTVENCPKISPFLGTLSIRPEGNTIFPKMSKLVIIYRHNPGRHIDRLNLHILVELIQSRKIEELCVNSKLRGNAVGNNSVRQGEEYKSQR
ncbi:hypothetical protein EDD18DRAFT_1368049 [Armillaria luteobubalina]|uniref:F-box domain-containing protein n=1 Tax=Armillaria luteobubalina TaxID=153913 RepID=A0AA39UCZ7_9AGAR|nr:hypothetical protein EDD18DRAFT_1368049 [Armillaria luteobubalina]